MRRAKIGDAKEMHALLEYTFGENYLYLHEVEEMIQNSRNLICVEERDGRIVAAILYLEVTKEQIMADMGVSDEDIERLSRGKRILHHKCSAVSEDYQRMGIGRRMFLDTLHILDEKGEAGVVFSLFWIKDSGEIPLKRLGESVGFAPLHFLPRPWWKYADRSCNVCGGRCSCNGYVYYRLVPLDE